MIWCVDIIISLLDIMFLLYYFVTESLPSGVTTVGALHLLPCHYCIVWDWLDCTPPQKNNLTQGHGCHAGIHCGNMQWAYSIRL